MVAHHRAQPLDSITAQHKPELEGPEASAELNTPVPEIDYRVVLRSTEILRGDPERAEQGLAVPDVVGAAVEVDQHPLVGIDHHAVRLLHTLKQRTELRNDGSSSSIGRVHMKPDGVLLADLGDGRKRIDSSGRGGSNRGYHTGGSQP